MTIDFYYVQGSPPCSIVSLTFAALGIEAEVKRHFLDFLTEDYLKPEFVKLNPQHTTPTIVDDGFMLCESRSIAKYLVGKYGNNKLYPQELKARALIDHMLDFDLGTLFCRFTEYYYPYVFGGSLKEKRLKRLHESIDIFNTFLEGETYAAGSELTLADLCLAVTVASIKAVGISVKEYSNIVRWFDLVKSTAIKFEEIVNKNIEDMVMETAGYRQQCLLKFCRTEDETFLYRSLQILIDRHFHHLLQLEIANCIRKT